MSQRVRKLRQRRAVPLHVGDVWVLIGPQTEVRIVSLAPRPTAQKPYSQAVTLSDGRTIAEATLRYAYMRKQEHQRLLRSLRVKWEHAKAEFFGEPTSSAKVLPFKRHPA